MDRCCFSIVVGAEYVLGVDQDVGTSNGHSKEVDPHSADVRINFYYPLLFPPPFAH